MTSTYAAILGSHPDISMFELERILPEIINHPLRLTRRGGIALIEAEQNIHPNIVLTRVGGTIKIVELLGTYSASVVESTLRDMATNDKKFSFGFSIYPLDDAKIPRRVAQQMERVGIAIKKNFRHGGRRARFVTSRSPILSSVIVMKEGLFTRGAECCMFVDEKEHIQWGITRAVQAFENFSYRDYGRPARDHRSGMLPPKVARMMLNIAAPKNNDVILDPFCGSGTIIQEALLCGYHNVRGSDQSAKAIADTKQNLTWLHLPLPRLDIADIRTLPKLFGTERVDCIITEGDLGPPRPYNAHRAIPKLTTLYENAFTIASRIMRPNGHIVIAIPAWRDHDKIITLAINNILLRLPFKHFHTPLFYGRPTARVLRHLYFLERTAP